MSTDITWKTADLPLERVERYFGMGVVRDGKAWIAHVMKDGRDAAIRRCETSARGAWDANERESHAMWLSLAKLISAGEVR